MKYDLSIQIVISIVYMAVIKINIALKEHDCIVWIKCYLNQKQTCGAFEKIGLFKECQRTISRKNEHIYRLTKVLHSQTLNIPY